mgnify:CR=1 FL=1
MVRSFEVVKFVDFWCHLSLLDTNVTFVLFESKKREFLPNPCGCDTVDFFKVLILGTPAQPETGVHSCPTQCISSD